MAVSQEIIKTNRQLYGLSARLAIYGLFVFLATMIDLLLFIFQLFTSFVARESYVIGSASTFIFISALLAAHDFERRRGLMLIELLAEALQKRSIKDNASSKNESESAEVNFDSMRNIKHINASIDLPLIPGKLGPLFYMVFNLTILLLIASRIPFFFFRL